MKHFADLSTWEVEDFESAVREALSDFKIEPVYCYSGLGFALSFDKDLYAFVASSRSHNTEGQRAYLRDDTALVRRIRPLVERATRRSASRIPGGRVFISRGGVSRRDSDAIPVQLCTWDWPL